MNFIYLNTEALAPAGGMGSSFILLAVMAVAMYFFVLRPNKKQQKKESEMRNSLEIGDEVTTIGGIIGIVVAIKEDTFVMETGSDRTKIRFRRNAIHGIEKLEMEEAKK